MPEHLSNYLACPLDGLALTENNEHNDVHCENGHHFDIARQGYINLLNVQHKRSKDPGDSKAMISARSRILDSGLYQPISEKLNELVAHHLLNTSGDTTSTTRNTTTNNTSNTTILDAGCGDGYYLDSCTNHLQKQHIQSHGIGLDISKWAIIAAAKRNKKITWLVGTNRQPPILASSIDVIICGFGFPTYDAFKKLLKPNGCVIMLESAEQHLIELRKVIYPSIKPFREATFSVAQEAGFSVGKPHTLCYPCEQLSQQAINDILTMSPHLYKASSEGKLQAQQLNTLDLTVDVTFTVLSTSS